MVVFYKIPVYSCSKEYFKQHYVVKENEKIESFKSEAYKSKLRREASSKLLWEFNQIIGYIVVYYENNEINFDVYNNNYSSRNYILSEKKKWFTEVMAPSRHIDVSDSNENISNDILRVLKAIKKDLFSKKAYLDLFEFNMYSKLIDYIGLINP